MEANRSRCFLGFIVLVLLFGFSAADSSNENVSGKLDSSSQLNTSSSDSNKKPDGSSLTSNSVPVDKENKGDDSVKKFKEGDVDSKSKTDTGSQVEPQKKDKMKKDEGDSGKKVKEKKPDGNKKSSGSGEQLQVVKEEGNKGKSESEEQKQEVKENRNKGNSQSTEHESTEKGNEENTSVSLSKEGSGIDNMEDKSTEKGNEENSSVSLSKEGSGIDKCDPSSQCTDEGKKIAACLKVRGESPDYSLLIQNKGKDALSVVVTAPDFVHLEETKINLQDKKDIKVTISSRNGGRNNLIVLTAGDGKCNLNISNLIAHNSGKEIDGPHKFAYPNFINFMPSRAPIIVVVCIVALLMLASSWICISRFHKKQPASNDTKYQRIDMMELPVSGREKSESKVDDGWDDNWGDDWDDEEAPSTPSLPVTPSVSSKGLASRRLNKDGWKD